MLAKTIRPSAKRNDRIARSNFRANHAMRMCPPSEQIFLKLVNKIGLYHHKNLKIFLKTIFSTRPSLK